MLYAAWLRCSSVNSCCHSFSCFCFMWLAAGRRLREGLSSLVSWLLRRRCWHKLINSLLCFPSLLCYICTWTPWHLTCLRLPGVLPKILKLWKMVNKKTIHQGIFLYSYWKYSCGGEPLQSNNTSPWQQFTGQVFAGQGQFHTPIFTHL